MAGRGLVWVVNLFSWGRGLPSKKGREDYYFLCNEK
jgi:hypothetical protein